MTNAAVPTDCECLQALRGRDATIDALSVLVARYLPFVHSSALRRLGNEQQAAEVTRAVFLVLARRARKLPRKTVLAGWLFQLTAIACRKISPSRVWPWRWFARSKVNDAPDVDLWARVAPRLDRAVDRLPRRLQHAVLLRTLLQRDLATTAQVLRISEPRADKRAARGLKQVAKALRKHAGAIDAETLAAACSHCACAVTSPPELAGSVVASAAEHTRPKQKLARRLLRRLAWVRWRRRVAWTTVTAILLVAATLAIAWRIDARSGHSRGIALWLEWSVRREAKKVPGLAQPANAWPANAATPRLDARLVRQAEDLYRTTNIWLAHLTFSRQQWKELEPKRIAPLPHFLQRDGTVLLRNPQAQRSGLAGVLGFDFNWARADLELGGMLFTNVAARVKGNGTHLASLWGPKRAFKVDLNKFTKGQKIAGADELNFNNLTVDQSFMSDALAYEFFREAGVPAPRTAYAYLSVNVDGQSAPGPLGLYVMVEPVDERFAAEHFGSKKTPIFKPVTYELFKHLGDDWTAYAGIYDLKTKATPEQERRVIEFARLVTHADDAEFAARVGDFLDLGAFARFLAGEVLMSNYDSILANGQNFYLYLHPRSNKFGFVPWDLDLAWGSFFLLATTVERERASIWRPWVGDNRFLERVMNVEAFRILYRAGLENMLSRQFVPERLSRRIDELAAVIREPVAAESDFRRRQFEEAITDRWHEPPLRPSSQGAGRPVHQIKRFIHKRAASVRQQLDGTRKGMILRRSDG